MDEGFGPRLTYKGQRQTLKGFRDAVELKYILTTEQIVDRFTKSLERERFEYFGEHLVLSDTSLTCMYPGQGLSCMGTLPFFFLQRDFEVFNGVLHRLW